MEDWKALAAKASGKAIKVEVFAENEGKWTGYKPFSIFVSPDSIDPYLSYRLISPSYVTYEELTLNQRCLENYDENVMVDNMLCGDEVSGQCVSCRILTGSSSMPVRSMAVRSLPMMVSIRRST